MQSPAVFAECRNCGTHLGTPPGKFCSECGQDTALHPPSAGEFLHEFVGHYVALEGKLWRTLGLLFFKPGTLTREYIEGRKQRYVLPLRLYLTASLLFFVIVKLIGAGDVFKVKMTDAERAQVASVAQPNPNLDRPANQIFQCDGLAECDKIRAYLNEKFQGKTMRGVIEQINRRMYSAAPYGMFALLPFFAGLTYLLYRRRRLMYGEHLVYAFHVHSFAFFSLLAMALVPPAAEFIFLVGLAYYYIALQRFFGGRWWMNALRYGIISLAYVLAFGLIVVGGFIVAALY